MNKFCRTIFGLSALFLFLCLCDSPIYAQSTTAKAETAKNELAAEPFEKKSEPEKTNNIFGSSPNRINIFNTGNYPSQTKTLTLDDAIRRALENNNDIEVARTDVRFQETQLRSLEGFYDPSLTLAPTFTRNSVTGSSATKDFRVNAGLNQNIRPGGGSISSFFNNNRSENRFAQSQLSGGQTSSSNTALFSSSLGIQYIQPLLRNFRIDNTRRQIKIQRKRLQQSDADFRRQTLEIISQVQRGYWDLVFALRDQQNRVANLNLAKENLRQIEARIAAGSAAPLARAEVATELANRETEVLTAAQQVAIAENTLKLLILRDSTAPDWRESIVPTDQPAFSLDAVNLDDALKDAVSNRPELRRLSLQREINDIDISFFKNQTKPQLDLNTTFSLNGIAQSIVPSTNSTLVPQFSGNDEILRQNLNLLLSNANLPVISNPITVVPPVTSPVFGGFGTGLRNIFRSDAPNFSIGVTFTFPLRNRTAEANLAGARIQQEQVAAQTRSQEQIVVAEVRNAVQAVETARQRVLTSRRARENAEIQLQGEQKLYDSGRSTTFLLFQRENALAAARNSEIRAETDYNKALSDLQRATSTTFRINNIEVQSPVDNQ